MACLSLGLGFRALSPQTPVSISSSSSSYSSLSSKRAATSRSSIRAKAIDPNNSFLSNLSSRSEANPDLVPTSNAEDSDNPTTLRELAMPSMVGQYGSDDKGVPISPPQDLASQYLDRRIVYIGMPLVPDVKELIIQELLYLQMMGPKTPIYLYINSTGATWKGEPVARESEGFAIYNTMMYVRNEIRTVALTYAIGQACLLLAAGKKGRRYMSPGCQVMIHQPKVPSSVQMPATDVLIYAQQLETDRNMLIKLLAKHTGNSEEIVWKVMQMEAKVMKKAKQRGFFMGAQEAQKFGLIDKILEA